MDIQHAAGAAGCGIVHNSRNGLQKTAVAPGFSLGSSRGLLRCHSRLPGDQPRG
jgi:hypothetical protein